MAAPMSLHQVHASCFADPCVRLQEPRQQSTLRGRVTTLEINAALPACEGRDRAASLGRTLSCAQGMDLQQSSIRHQLCSSGERRNSTSSNLATSMCQPSRFRRRTATNASERPPQLSSHKDNAFRSAVRFQGAFQRWLQARGNDRVRDAHHFPPPDNLRGKEAALRQEVAAALHASPGPLSRDLQDGIAGLGEVSKQEALSGSLRQRLEVTLALAFVLNNMDKVSLSVAIIVMAQQLEWSTSTQGLVQASFFWGYALTQIPGGWLAQRVGGESMLWWGVLLWSLATLAVPTCAAVSIPAMLIARVLVGLGEGVAPSAATDAIARNVPSEERSRAVSLVFGGFNVGSVVGLILSPILVEAFGWESVFHVFGALGVLWCAGYSFLRGPSSLSLGKPAGQGQPQPGMETLSVEPSTPLSGLSSWQSETGSSGEIKDLQERRRSVPWGALLGSQSVRALIACHFCHDWGKYCLQAWLPTFYASYLHLSLTEASMAALIPPVGSVVVAAVAGNLADSLVASGMPLTQVRRICQSIAFTAPALAMAGAWAVMEAQGDPSLVLLLLSGGLALSSFALAGLYCSHQDISPKYSPVLLGLSNTAGALPGFVGVTLTGYLYEVTHSWNVALFLPSIVVLGLGASIWVKWVDNSEVDFDSEKA